MENIICLLIYIYQVMKKTQTKALTPQQLIVIKVRPVRREQNRTKGCGYNGLRI